MGVKGICHIWNEEKIEQLRNACRKAKNWQEVAKKIGESSSVCAVIATREKIERPFISRNHGGARQGAGRPRKY
jgi:hypothetical protein